MIDLRHEFGQILDEYGYYILLQRSNRKVHCRCWNPVDQEADPNCHFCNGSSWIIRLERHKCRTDSAMQAVTYPNMNQSTLQGNTWMAANNIYVRHNVKAKVGDIIYEVGWKGLRPTNLIAVYEINHIQPLRADGGRTEFFRLSVKIDTVGKRGIIPRIIGGQVFYETAGDK